VLKTGGLVRRRERATILRMRKAALLVLFSSWLLIAIVTIIFAVVTYPDNFLTSSAAKAAYIRNKFAERIAAASAEWAGVTWDECEFERTRFQVRASKDGLTYVARSFAVHQCIVEMRQDGRVVARYRPQEANPALRWNYTGPSGRDYEIGLACEELYLAFSTSVFYKQAWW
jgi:hypothetical protein